LPRSLFLLLLLPFLSACGMGGLVDSLVGSKLDTPVGESMTSGERSLALEVFALVNRERLSAGVEPLVWDEAASDAAYDHCTDMRVRGFYDHVDPDGDGPCERLHAAGVETFSCGGENIARNNPTAADVMNAWMNSPGHRLNILAPGYTRIGIGVHTGKGGPWWTQDFFIPPFE